MSRRQTERCLPRAREFGLSWLEDQREKILYGLAKSGGRQLEEACSRVLEELVHVNAPADFMHVGMDDQLTVAERLQGVLLDYYGIDASLEVPLMTAVRRQPAD